MLGGAPDISLGQKYLTTADPFDPNYNTPDLHSDLKKLTCPTALIKFDAYLQICSNFYNWDFFHLARYSDNFTFFAPHAKHSKSSTSLIPFKDNQLSHTKTPLNDSEVSTFK